MPINYYRKESTKAKPKRHLGLNHDAPTSSENSMGSHRVGATINQRKVSKTGETTSKNCEPKDPKGRTFKK